MLELKPSRKHDERKQMWKALHAARRLASQDFKLAQKWKNDSLSKRRVPIYLFVHERHVLLAFLPHAKKNTKGRSEENARWREEASKAI